MQTIVCVLVCLSLVGACSRAHDPPPLLPPVGDACGGSAWAGLSPCGGTRPCQLSHNELVPATAEFRNDAPSIQTDSEGGPVLFYSLAVAGFHGYLARRDAAGTWSQHTTSIGAATGSLGGGIKGVRSLVVYDGKGTSWGQVVDGDVPSFEPIAGRYSFGEGRLAEDARGCDYVALVEADGGDLRLGRRQPAGTWDFATLIAGPNAEDPRIAMGPDGRPHLIAWTTSSAIWGLTWVGPDGARELVEDLGTNVLPRKATALTVDREGVPHVMVQHEGALTYRRRAGAAEWSSTKIVAAKTDGGCALVPTHDGETCTQTDHLPQLIGAVTSSDGEVRFVWHERDVTVKRTASCPLGTSTTPDLGQPSCSWEQTSRVVTGSLKIATPDSLTTPQALALDAEPWSGSVALDGSGGIHLALYDREDVRYVHLAP